MDSIIETLEFIKSHTGCGTENIEYTVVLDLYNLGYVEGGDVSSYDGFAFKNLRLTISGSEYLESLKSTQPKPNHAANPAPDIVNYWHNKPIGKIFVGVSIAVLSAVVIWMFAHYLGIRLG